MFDITKEAVPYINGYVSIEKISEDFYCKEGDIVFADASEDLNDVGKSIEIINLNNEKLLAGLHTLLGRPKENYFYNGFNGYLFKSSNIRLQIQKESQGTKVLSISARRISNINLYFPTIQEQKKIANLLALIDFRIQTQNEIIENLNTQLQNLSHKIFNEELRFKDDNGNAFPDWQEKELKDICSFYSGGTPRSTNKSFYLGNIPFIGSGNISDSYVDNFITDKALKSSSAKLVDKGDILYALYGATSGEVAISKISGAINQAVLCIRTRENKSYLFYLLKNSKDRIVQTYIQGGQGNLSAKIIKELKFNFPSYEEQIKIASFLDLIDEKLQVETSFLKCLSDQKQYLLQQLFI